MTRSRLLGFAAAASAFVLLASAAAAAPPPPPAAPQLDETPPALTNQQTATFKFSQPGGDNSGISYTCTLDSGTPQDCSSGSITYPDPTANPAQPPLAEGSHTFSVVATHGSDTSPATTYPWTIDTTPPDAAITKAPPSVSGQSATFEFGNGESGVTYVCSLDGAPASCSSPQTYGGLADGAHSFHVQATDPAGNVATSADYGWTVDTSAPAISMSAAPSLRTNETTATFAFTSDDGSARFLCSFDGAAFTPCTSPASFAGLGDGAHTFRLEAADALGNLRGPVAYSWVVDTTSPGPVQRLRALVGYRRLALSWQLPSDSDLDHLTLFERRPRSVQSIAAYSGLGSRFTEAKIDNSRTYRFSIVTYDSVGNASGAATVSVPPYALLGSPRAGAKVGASPSLSWAPARGATFYNVQVFRNGKKILSTWPRSTHLRMAAHWNYAGHPQRLHRGWYQWYVWPAFGRGRSMRYGQELGHSSFRR